ncbi:MAG: trehalose-phosphatase [Actinomycetota bacterium]|nr:trehalose-phosphatase [Actinomycetota bacterium]
MASNIDAIRAVAARGGVFVDFDGTLSEIASSPEAAVAVPGAAEALEVLARRFALVAVVSGRPAAEVRAKLSAPEGVRWFGLYGLEEEPERSSSYAPDEVETQAELLLPAVRTSVRDLEGVRLEPKGPTLAVHYRNASDPEAVRTVLLDRLASIAETTGLRLIEGKRVLELAPADAPTKGEVVRRHGRGLEAVLYAGDDLADLSAFGAVDELVADGTAGLKVAVRSQEPPRELLTAADLVVDGPPDLVRLLRRLVG